MSGRPRGRPRSFDTDVALGAARERFRTSGFEGTSLDALSEATGLKRPSLYAAFGDKRALYLQALASTAGEVEKAFDMLLAARLDMRATLEAILERAIDGYLGGEAGPSGCILASTAATAAVTDPAVRAALQAFLDMQDRRIAAVLSRAGDREAEAHALLVSSVLHSLSIRARAGTSRKALRETGNALIATLLLGTDG